MNHFKNIYNHKAPEYHHMVAAEDVEKNLLSTLEQVTPFIGKTILDLGTGTGRLPLLIADRACTLIGLDLHRAMLIENRFQREIISGDWELVQGDMQTLPLPSRWADVVFAG